MKKFITITFMILFAFLVAACSDGFFDTLRDNDIVLEFSLDGFSVKTITSIRSAAMKPARYSRYDFEKLEFSSWNDNPHIENEENPYSESVIEMTFTKEQAIIFLDDLEKAGLFQLEKNYTFDQIIMDGGGWDIEVVFANEDIFTSGGWNAYPPVKIRKAMDDAASRLGNPKRFWVSAEDAESYGYSDEFVGSKTHDQYPGCTIRIDLKNRINWSSGYRDSNDLAIDENFRLQRLVDMKKHYAELADKFIYEGEEGIYYAVDVNPYLPHIRIDFYGRQEYKDHLNNIEMTDMNYFKSVIGKLEKSLKKLDSVRAVNVYWASRQR
ncbi:MAG: hypothetical protein FWE62_00295 [Firmicutes bacterium]|nr:hypothetical protein [Bacillota bacterium]